ncbi:ABC transporter ATP-binding protein [Marivirga lumbricoides]|uniref:ABC transporter ATP-binding protein n=1 Tax=Marivirga lumbricoides TaxID=1046115 RepID=A0A2T4DS48_9BACT|nr:ABC transporter ATP-binding protein [Marivirga lumbricoides]
MSDTAIKVEGLGKQYIIGHKKQGDLRYALGDKIKGLFKPDASEKEIFWALKDINFEIKHGEAVGIIGRNGAGKSTLLKILSRITEPSTGRFTINGRVSSLLEVGTGFHMELTGRENIYLNGTILGMKRAEIRQKFDEIVDFSGVEKFLDTPVKHYSSGMKVRLAFSVAAHLEPEILIVDEVLAVGDAEFQKKCLGKMDQVSKNEGRTVIFVSHNLAAVSQLCNKGILLRQGNLILENEVNAVIHEYISYNRMKSNTGELINLDLRKGDGRFKVNGIRFLDNKSNPIKIGRTGSKLIFEVNFNREINPSKGSFRIDFAIDNEQDQRIAWFSSDAVNAKLESPFENLKLKIPKFPFGSGTYYLTFYITVNGQLVDYIHQGYAFTVEEGDFFGTGKTIPKSQTFIYTDHLVEI